MLLHPGLRPTGTRAPRLNAHESFTINGLLSAHGHDDAELRAGLKALAEKYPRHGYPRALTESVVKIHKRTYRIYVEVTAGANEEAEEVDEAKSANGLANQSR